MSLRRDQRPRSRTLALNVSPSATVNTFAVQIRQVGFFCPGMHGPRRASAAGASALAIRTQRPSSSGSTRCVVPIESPIPQKGGQYA
jgi:hypothetical protein